MFQPWQSHRLDYTMPQGTGGGEITIMRNNGQNYIAPVYQSGTYIHLGARGEHSFEGGWSGGTWTGDGNVYRDGDCDGGNDSSHTTDSGRHHDPRQSHNRNPVLDIGHPAHPNVVGGNITLNAPHGLPTYKARGPRPLPAKFDHFYQYPDQAPHLFMPLSGCVPTALNQYTDINANNQSSVEMARRRSVETAARVKRQISAVPERGAGYPTQHGHISLTEERTHQKSHRRHVLVHSHHHSSRLDGSLHHHSQRQHFDHHNHKRHSHSLPRLRSEDVVDDAPARQYYHHRPLLCERSQDVPRVARQQSQCTPHVFRYHSKNFPHGLYPHSQNIPRGLRHISHDIPHDAGAPLHHPSRHLVPRRHSQHRQHDAAARHFASDKHNQNTLLYSVPRYKSRRRDAASQVPSKPKTRSDDSRSDSPQTRSSTSSHCQEEDSGDQDNSAKTTKPVSGFKNKFRMWSIAVPSSPAETPSSTPAAHNALARKSAPKSVFKVFLTSSPPQGAQQRSPSRPSLLTEPSLSGRTEDQPAVYAKTPCLSSESQSNDSRSSKHSAVEASAESVSSPNTELVAGVHEGVDNMTPSGHHVRAHEDTSVEDANSTSTRPVLPVCRAGIRPPEPSGSLSDYQFSDVDWDTSSVDSVFVDEANTTSVDTTVSSAKPTAVSANEHAAETPCSQSAAENHEVTPQTASASGVHRENDVEMVKTSELPDLDSDTNPAETMIGTLVKKFCRNWF